MDPLHLEIESDYQQRDWSELNTELLHFVSRKLFDLFDFVRFRAICKNWRFAAPTSNHHSLHPCLFAESSNIFFLYSLHSGKAHKIDLSIDSILVPKSLNWHLFPRPIAHYILVGTIGRDTLTLINPFTKNKVILPPLDHKFCKYMWTSLINYKVSEHIALTGFEEHTYSRYLALYRHDDNKWVTIRKDFHGWYPMIYYKGMYYLFVYETENTEVIDATQGELRSIIPSPQSRSNVLYPYIARYFIESSVELLLVCKFTKVPPHIGCDFEIYRLNQKNDDLRWIKLNEIADQALFLGYNGGFSIRITDSDRFKGNCIYFISRYDTLEENSYSKEFSYVWKFDIKNGSLEKLPYTCSEAATWILPSLQ